VPRTRLLEESRPPGQLSHLAELEKHQKEDKMVESLRLDREIDSAAIAA
jgi:hypothetical protein